jgi:two-component system LytT family sensor kinase
MKQLLLILILFLIGLNILQAQEKKSYEETTWNVIRERLFNGNNPKACRFEDDILIQLKGDVTKQDSTIVKKIISELNDLIETVDVKLVDNKGNLILTIHSPENGTSTRFNAPNNTISKVEINIASNDNSYQNEKQKYFQYNIITHLTKTYEPRFGKTSYFGFFDTSSYQEARRFTEIDKDLLRKLYSNDFYKQLRKNTVKNWNYLYYLNLRFEDWIKKISTSLSIILVIIGFLYLLSKEKSNRKLTFWNYQSKGIQILLWILVSYLLLIIPEIIPIAPNPYLTSFVFGTFIEVLVIGIFALIIMFFIEHLFLDRIHNFLYKQIFILSTSFSVIFSSYFFIYIPFIYLNLKSNSGYSSYSELFNPSIIFYILIICSLRVLYNFINYRMQSLVNEKDVELAKMKELKNQAELNALHSRINPHFLYNSLNSIATLTHTNPDKTENMAIGLSELFRYSINKEDKTFVTVEEELEMVKKYLEIEKTRFEDKLVYRIEAAENVKEKLIPKFLIQPLAENAIKHGLSKIKEVGKITIEVKQLENDLVITIFDNGPDFPVEPVSGYGLQNLNDKLEIIYGVDAFINWENGDNKHFKITIKNQFKG